MREGKKPRSFEGVYRGFLFREKERFAELQVYLSECEMKDKFLLYEESGVLEYWIVSPIEKAIQVFRLNEQGRYYGIQLFTEDDDLTTPILSGVDIPLKEVFAD